MIKKIMAVALSSVLFMTLLAGCQNNGVDSQEKSSQTVKLAYVNWSEGIAMTNLAAAVLEDKMGYTVELTMADAAPVFTSLSSGNTDAFLDVWLPVTHKDYLDKYGENIVDLGISYENARLGLVVPSYVEINSIEELNAHKDLFDGEIIGIDAGAGIMQAAENAIPEYELDYKILTGSGPTMTAALGKAIDKQEPIVVTGWAPHWMFAKWDLKILEDPKNVFGESENIHKYARKNFQEDSPEAAEFLSRFKLTETELGDLMGAIEEDSREPLEVAREWAKNHEDLIQSWLPENQ